MYLIDVSGLGYTFDLSKLSHNTSGGPTGSTVGSIYSWDAASAGQGQSGMCYMYDATKIKCIGVQAQGSSGIAGNSTWPTSINFSTSNYNVGVHLTIPIIGQTNSTVINAECPSAGQCEDLFTADVNTSGTITNQTPVNWLSSCTSFAPSVCTFVTNHFSVTPKCWAATTTSSTTSFGFDTTYSGTTSVTMDRKDELGTRRSIDYTLFCRRATTDFKGKRVLQAQISNTLYSAANGIKTISGEFNCDASSSIFSSLLICLICFCIVLFSLI